MCRVLVGNDGEERLQTLVVVTLNGIEEGSLETRLNLGRRDQHHEREAELHGSLLRLFVTLSEETHQSANREISALGHEVLHDIALLFDARPVQRCATEEVLLVQIIPAFHEKRNAVWIVILHDLYLPKLPA